MLVKEPYWVFEGALDAEDCHKIISIGNQKISEQIAQGNSTRAVTRGHIEKSDDKIVPQSDKTVEEMLSEGVDTDKAYIRDSEVVWLNEPWLYDLVMPFVHKANKNAGWHYTLEASEDFQFTKYENTGFYGWHNDGATDWHARYKRLIPGLHGQEESKLQEGFTMNKNYINRIRKLSVTINLNPGEDYDGGNLKFDFGPHSHERFSEVTQARVQGSVIVFPSFQYHCVTPVTRGTRYSLVLWSLGAPFK